MRWTRSLGRLGTCLALACGAAHAQQPYPQGGWPGHAPAAPYPYTQQVGLPVPPGPPPGPPPGLYPQYNTFNPLASGPAGPPPVQHVVPRQPGPPPGPPVNIPTPPPSVGPTDANPEGKPSLGLGPHAPLGCPPEDCPPPVVMQSCPVDGTLVRCPCVYPQMIGASMDYFYRPDIRQANPGRVTAYVIGEPPSPLPQRGLPPAVLRNFVPSQTLGSSFGLPPNVILVALPGPQVFPGELETVLRVPVATRGAWRVADNESPQPQDRVYLGYNFFQDVGENFNGGLLAAYLQPNGTLLQSNGQTVLVPLQPPRMRVYQGTIGIEKTIPNNPNASVGVRLPIYAIRNGAGLDDDNIDKADLGDVSVMLKVAIVNDLAYSGYLASTGVLVTTPTGPDLNNFNGEDIHTFIVQPFLAGLADYGPVYVHSFSSVAIPAEGPEPVLLFGDLGVGWYAYRSNYFWLSAIVPTAEAHVTIPLTHRNLPEAPVRAVDQLMGTLGVHFVIGPGNSTVSFAGSVPCLGPRTFDYELIAQFNYRF